MINNLVSQGTGKTFPSAFNAVEPVELYWDETVRLETTVLGNVNILLNGTANLPVDNVNFINAHRVSQEPLIVFEPNAIHHIGQYFPFIEEAIKIGVTLSSDYKVPVGAVRVSRFVSKDDPSFIEIFVTFYSGAERQKLIEFFPILSEHLGEWGNSQPDAVRTALTSKLTMEILPIGLWQYVRS